MAHIEIESWESFPQNHVSHICCQIKTLSWDGWIPETDIEKDSHSNAQSKYLGPACQSNICPFEYNDNYLAGFKECYGKGYRLFNPCESEKNKYKFNRKELSWPSLPT